MVAVANSSLLAQQRVRVYRLFTQIDNQDVRLVQICAERVMIDDYCLYLGQVELNVWPCRFALFEAIAGDMVRVPQEHGILEMPTPSYWSFD